MSPFRLNSTPSMQIFFCALNSASTASFSFLLRIKTRSVNKRVGLILKLYFGFSASPIPPRFHHEMKWKIFLKYEPQNGSSRDESCARVICVQSYLISFLGEKARVRHKWSRKAEALGSVLTCFDWKMSRKFLFASSSKQNALCFRWVRYSNCGFCFRFESNNIRLIK